MLSDLCFSLFFLGLALINVKEINDIDMALNPNTNAVYRQPKFIVIRAPRYGHNAPDRLDDEVNILK